MQRAVERYERAVAQARTEGTVLLGGERLTGGIFDRGHFVAPTIARLPLESSLFQEELFVPFLAVGEVARPGSGASPRPTGSSTA